VRAPFYDERTNNLTWSLALHSGDDSPTVNHSVRLLGRGGVLRVDLVLGHDALEAVLPAFDRVIAGTTFVPEPGTRTSAPATRWRPTGWRRS
jgi:uncharacterized membrane-anchored protein